MAFKPSPNGIAALKPPLKPASKRRSRCRKGWGIRHKKDQKRNGAGGERGGAPGPWRGGGRRRGAGAATARARTARRRAAAARRSEAAAPRGSARMGGLERGDRNRRPLVVGDGGGGGRKRNRGEDGLGFGVLPPVRSRNGRQIRTCINFSNFFSIFLFYYYIF